MNWRVSRVGHGEKTYTLLNADSTKELHQLTPESVDLVLTDIPYGIDLADWDVLHSNTNSALGGQSPAQKKMGSGFKRRGKPINGWSQADLDRPREYQQWCLSWVAPLLRALKPGASAFVFGGRRTIHRALVAFEDAGFLLRDMLAWKKTAGHFRAQSLSKLYERQGNKDAACQWAGWRLGNLAPLFEPVAWLFKPYRIGGTIAQNVLEHGVGAMNIDACRYEGKVPSNILNYDFEKGERGLHDAQKPTSLLRFLITLTTNEGQTVLDPFMGSGSTGVAACQLGRRFIGIEIDRDFCRAAQDRLSGVLKQAQMRLFG